MRDNYEELRAFALSPVKFPVRPLGLDLWFKKGFLSWSTIMLHRNLPSESIRCTPVHFGIPDISADLTMSLSNILIEWSDTHDKQ